MTTTYDLTEYACIHSPAITHLDKTARPQLVDETNNPDIYAIIKSYHEITGRPILINTSFNMHGEPIVCSPHDAIRAFILSELDVLSIGDYIVMQ